MLYGACTRFNFQLSRLPSHVLDDVPRRGNGFMMPVNEVKPTVEETWAGINAMCMEIKPEFDFQFREEHELVQKFS